MMPTYILWAMLDMAGYSFGTLFVKLAERGGVASTHTVLAVSSMVVAVCALAIVALRGELREFFDLDRGTLTAPKPYDRTGVGENTILSASDRDWARRFYPAGSSLVPIEALQFERLDAVAGQQRDYVFVPKATREYTIQTVGESDCKVVVFEEREGTPRHFAAEDDSGT